MIVAKLDDVTIGQGWQGRGVGSAMLAALGDDLRARGITRIDTACHRDNAGAWRFYERLGFEVVEAEDGSVALARAKERAPTVVLLDWNMPVMSGIDFLTVARWVGHEDGGILIGKVYGHLSGQLAHMREAARKATGG